jgi:hypothetical protein
MDQFLQSRQQQGRAPQHHRVTLRTFLKEWRDAGMLPVPVQPKSSLDMLAQAFDDSLTSERGLARITREHYLPMVRRFLQERLGTGPRGLPALNIHDGTQERRVGPAVCVVRSSPLRQASRSSRAARVPRVSLEHSTSSLCTPAWQGWRG